MNDNFYTIKSSLSSICNNELIIKKINDFVLNASHLINNSYILSNFHIMRILLNNNNDDDESLFTKLFSQQYFQNILQLASYQNYSNSTLECKDNYIFIIK